MVKGGNVRSYGRILEELGTIPRPPDIAGFVSRLPQGLDFNSSEVHKLKYCCII